MATRLNPASPRVSLRSMNSPWVRQPAWFPADPLCFLDSSRGVCLLVPQRQEGSYRQDQQNGDHDGPLDGPAPDIGRAAGLHVDNLPGHGSYTECLAGWLIWE